MNLHALVLTLTLGALAGYGLRQAPRAVAGNRAAMPYAIGALLFFMGSRLAVGRAEFTRDLGALLAAAASSVLLVALYFLGFYLLGLRARGALAQAEPAAAGPGRHPLGAVLWNSAWILGGFLVFAALPGRLGAAIPADRAADWILRALLVIIGFDLGAEFHQLKAVRLPLPLLLVPFVNILLSLGCGLLFSALWSLPGRSGMLLYSGLGWYSLSSVLIAQHGLVLAALLAFIHNVTRELLAIVTAPFAARINPYLPVYLGGATAMDTMLPFVQRYSGRTYTLVSFYSGAVCSLAVIPLVRVLLG
jgi:uncharacterized membrane protein YbjE (DUF340 family)